MDKETREFLSKQFETIDARFDKIDTRFDKVDAKFEAIDAKFEKIDGKFEKVDARLEAIDAKFDKIDENFETVDAKFDGMQQHIETKAAENRRHFEVVAEGLRGEIQQIAEGHQVLLEGQTRIVERVEEGKRELAAMIKFSYADLDHPMRALEETVPTFQSRVEHIESRLN